MVTILKVRALLVVSCTLRTIVDVARAMDIAFRYRNYFRKVSKSVIVVDWSRLRSRAGYHRGSSGVPTMVSCIVIYFAYVIQLTQRGI